MTIREPETNKPGPIDPTGFWRLLFWLAFVLGSLSLVLSWLLAQIPGPPHGAELLPHYISRLCAALLMLVSIAMARWLWKIRNPIADPGHATAMRLVICAAWLEGAIALIGIIGIAISRH